MKPHIVKLPRTDDAERFRVFDESGSKVIVISGCLQAVTRKPVMQLLIERLKEQR